VRLDEFYADRKRADSEEVNFGSAWRLEGEGLWEVVWLEATGELVAFSVAALQGWEPSGFGGDGFLVLELAAEGIRRLFSHDARNTHADPAAVLIIGVEPALFRLRAALFGWEDHMREENGLAWLAGRVDGLSRGPAG
jgi:hypothetical protein